MKMTKDEIKNALEKALGDGINEAIKKEISNLSGRRSGYSCPPIAGDDDKYPRNSPRGMDMSEEEFERRLKAQKISTGYETKELDLSGEDGSADFKSFREFLNTVRNQARSPDARLTRLTKTASGHMTVGDDSQGGFLVPELYGTEVLSLAMESAFIEDYATKFTIGTGDSIKIPKIDETTRASATSVFGGITCSWTQEAGTITASKPALEQLTLSPYKLTGMCYLTSELLEDSQPSAEVVVRELFAKSIGYYLQLAYMRGTGVGEPMGIINSTALLSHTKTGAANELLLRDLAGMYSKLTPGSQGRAIWIMSPSVIPALFDLAARTPASGSYYPVFVIDATKKPAMSLFGRPIYFSEFCEVLNTANDIILADLSYYIIGIKGGLVIDSSTHVAFTTDEVAFRFRLRRDGQPNLDTVLTLYDGSSTISPFVNLSTRS